MPELYAEITNKTKGMVMYSKSKRKDNNKESFWEVKKVRKDQLTINNSEWEFKRIGEE